MTVVAVLALILAVLLAMLCGILIAALRGVRTRADALAAQVAALEPAGPASPDIEAALGNGPRRVLVVEVLNPIELALSRTRAAGVVAAMAPDRLRRIVVEQTAREMQVQLESEGVQAEVSIHAVG